MAVCSSLPERMLKTWSSKGKDEALSLFQKAFRGGAGHAVGEGHQELRSLVCDLVRHVVSGSLESEDAVTFLAELVSTLGIKDIFPSLLADVLTILDAEVTCNESKEQRTAFKALTSASMELVGGSLLKERLDMDALEMVGLVQSKTNFNQKYVKTKTKLFYKQQKFNLFREENEGYSKLIAELGHERRPDRASPAMLDNIKSLIGRFNLDPNRVLDVILEAFECHLDEKDFFLPLLQGYCSEPATFVNILGCKFQCYQHDELSKCSPTSPSLYRLAAVLLHEGLVKLQDLYPHLGPRDAKLKEFHESVMEEAKTKAKKAFVISLAEKTDEEREKEAEEERERQELRERVLSLATNQKLGLCHAYLELGDWEGASALVRLLPPFLPAWAPPITESLCRLVNIAIEPLYKSYSPRAAKGSPLPPAPENLQRCSRFEHLHPEVFEMLYQLGPHVHRDPLLLAKILRLGRAFLKEWGGNGAEGELPSQERAAVYQGFLSVLDEVIFPALSLLHCNCGLAEETWAMIKQLPYETRYLLYGYWKNRSYDLHPELMEARTLTLNRGKYIMKRITKDNVKPSGRQIAKYSHSNPGIIFDYVLSQIQRYDNFIIPVVDSLKYLTPITYDVLAYCIIEALGNPQKERLKHEDTNISNWLQGLSNFCGNVFKKYPIELTGLLQYIANQLKAGKSFDLLVLKEVVQKMSGIEISCEMTTSQLEALAGGELLKAEGGYFSQVRNTKKSSQRLREALVEADLSLPLCLLMAQQRECIVFKESVTRHLKLVGMLYDHCLDTLVQFGGFLSTHLSPDEYSRRIPPLSVLGLEYHIPADIAFFMLRPLISNSISEKFAELDKARKAEAAKQDKKSKASRQEVSYCAACQHVMDPLIEAARLLHPAKVWEDISCKLYSTFWALSLYDLYVPTSRYEEEISKTKHSMHTIENKEDMPSSKRKKEQERSSALIEKLQEERQRQEDNHRLINTWLHQERDSWFNPRVTKNRTITQFLQLCIFPRCQFTASDAIYCAKFVYTLHSLQTPNFSTLLFFDRVFSDISYTLSCCTENEVRRYGRFLGALLEIVSKWHASETVYSQECAKTPGFISMMRSSGAGNEKQYLDYENYRHITFKWHFKLTKSLVILLESKDYMQVRNGLIVLTKVLPHYPKVFHLSIALEKRVEKIMEEEKEKRPDLYALAIGYVGMLKSHKHNGCLVQEGDFHNREERVKAQQGDSESKSFTKTQEREGGVSGGGKEEKHARALKLKAEAEVKSSEEAKGKSSSSSSKEQVSAGEPAGKGASQKEREKEKEKGKNAGKAEVKSAASEKNAASEKLAKERNERSGSEKEKKGGGKEDAHGKISGALAASVAVSSTVGEQEVSSTAKSAKGGKSPSVHNGPVEEAVSSSPARTGQRRQHMGEEATHEENDAKRRKLDVAKSKLEDHQKDSDHESSVEKKDKPKKRERLSENETSETKRRKETPDITEVEVKEKKRVLKVSKKEAAKTTAESSPPVTKKVVAVKKDKEDEKTKKHSSSIHSGKARPVKK